MGMAGWPGLSGLSGLVHSDGMLIVEGLIGCFDADDETTVDDPTEGAPVSSWLDKSGNGHDATQTDSVRKPTYLLAKENGRNVLSFDGVNDHIDPALGTGLEIDDYTLFLVATHNAAPVQTLFAVQSNEGTGQHSGFAVLILSNNNLQWRMAPDINGHDQHTAPNAVSSGDPHIITVKKLGAVGTFYVDGSQIAQAGFPANIFYGGVNRKTIIGSDIGGTVTQWHHDGFMLEIKFYNDVKNDTDRSEIELQLSTKWNIPLV